MKKVLSKSFKNASFLSDVTQSSFLEATRVLTEAFLIELSRVVDVSSVTNAEEIAKLVCNMTDSWLYDGVIGHSCD